MKKLIALSICLAACNIYAQDSNNIPEQDNAPTTIEMETKEYNATEQTEQETYSILVKNAQGEEEVIPALLVTLEETKAILNSQEVVEFLEINDLTPDQAFDSIVNHWTEIKNKAAENKDATFPTGGSGIAFIINNTPYFIKASEFTTDNDVTTSREDSEINN